MTTSVEKLKRNAASLRKPSCSIFSTYVSQQAHCILYTIIMASQDGNEAVVMETEGSPKKEESACANLGDGDAEANEEIGQEDGRNSSTQCQASVSNGGDTDDGKETVDLKIIWNKNKYDLRIPLDGTGASLKERIHSLTGLPPSMQKVMYKGLLPEDKTLREIKVTNGAKIMVVGSTINDVLAVNTPKEVIQQEVKAEENKKEPLCQQKQHRKVLDKGKPEDIMPSVKGTKERLPTVPLSGMYNKSGGKVRLTFKLEQDQLWIGTKERTEKLPMGSIKNVVTEPIEGHDDYYMMAFQLGPTEASYYWVYWVPVQYVDAIKDTVLGKWQYF
ncbi:ubiquitin domain-containing protein UBFD1-like isoform X1 [Acipenser ruthenus]|uniref:ubiquitin domain-containing protein UBFD1-like isoform X1 n=2 Tax=Acipenser ruthenus TaxID=7906 RepID=UPI0027416CF0|nr:ubiquitin domain-containing protein UBFD1-like isoform X1 [Acipenser ruthenus]